MVRSMRSGEREGAPWKRIALLVGALAMGFSGCAESDGDGSSGDNVGGDAGAGGSGSGCSDTLEACESSLDCCSFEEGCDPDFKKCVMPCSHSDDCLSGCCRPVEGSRISFCVPSDQCSTCQRDGESCTQNGDCCDYPGLSGCFTPAGLCGKFCSDNSDCSTFCCAPEYGACMPSSFCR